MSYPPPPPAQPYFVASGQPPPPGPGYPSYPTYPPPPDGGNSAYRPYSPPADYQATAGPMDDSSGFAASGFDDKTIRRKFISKVYAVLTVQLMVTMAFVCVFLFVQPVRYWVQRNMWFYWLSYAVFIVTYFTLACCPNVRRRVPGNYIALAVFTLSFSYLAGTISSAYNVNSVLICLVVTAGVTLTVSLAAIACPCDITKCQAMLAFLSILLLIFGLVCTIVYFVAGYNSVLNAVYGGIAAIIFSIYLAYDTQMVIGGRRYELSPEDYIFGALQLYVDVVQLFLSFLALFGSNN
ncbi:hypothetical protein AAHC03_05673 [Spirometra sp. Aus1]